MKTFLWLVIFFMGMSVSVKADDTNAPTREILLVATATSQDLGFWEHYNEELERGSTILIDRFGQPSRLGWVHVWYKRGRLEQDRIDSIGRNTAKNLVLNGLRESFVARIEFDQIKDFPKNLLIGSIGNTPEKETEPVSSTFSVTEAGLRKRMNEVKSFQYGFRVGQNSYMYANEVIRNKFGTPVVFTRFRVHYSILNSSQVDGSIAIPLGKKWLLDAGVFADPMRWNDRVTSIRLEKVFYELKGLDRALYFGVRTTGRGSMSADLGFSSRF